MEANILNPVTSHALRAASVAELVWIGQDGWPNAAPVTPLFHNDRPAIALPYAYKALAVKLGAADGVGLAVSDPRMTGSGWQPAAVVGRGQVLEDRDGTIFVNNLLTQELRKFPPSRALADSLLLQKENWWYLPRLIVTIDAQSTPAVAERLSRNDQLLAVASPSGLHVDTVHVARVTDDQCEMTSLAGNPIPDGPAVLLGHDFSEPDLERWSSWITRGEAHDGVVIVSEWPTATSLEPTLTLRERYRRHRELKKACQKTLSR